VLISIISTEISGRIPASSHASRLLSTASFIVVRSDLLLLSNPRRCLFFAKNSEIEISLCFSPVDIAIELVS